MLMKHFSHMVFHPKESLQDADRQPARPIDIILHVFFLSLIPTVCGYLATVHIGWDLGAGDRYLLTPDKALIFSAAALLLYNVGVYMVGLGICKMAKMFDVEPTQIHCIELAAFTSVPLFAAGFLALYPVLSVILIGGLLALSASIYLLYLGVPIFMHIPEEKGFIYSTCVVTVGMVALVAIMVLSVMIWSLVI
ncbi:MAG: YIP1 family protein [Gammaproteobacteria bacterium]|nr:YIP1 family protein [Gammaproteobacteria bacterium]